MKKFFSEFKKFITRGNVVDMAVGVIVGSSFTAIVNGLSNYILKPIINWILSLILGGGALDKVYTFLVTAYVPDANGNPTSEIDLAKSIYIDWGSFINAVINFFLVALVLFTILKVINRLREGGKKLETINGKPPRADRAEMRALGMNYRDKEAVAEFYRQREEKAAAAKAAEEEKARLEREANPTTEDLLKEILECLKNK